ncbi:regulatory protein [Natronocella acetinitrilica]|uniref:Regulatory protein RecX n=1 Tax=Natronocella acetinitrilica TaxID=414046 RepID=A0AAE3G7X9_9GAMM|nr:regulatory protein [Natronocella acetinitrilica]
MTDESEAVDQAVEAGVRLLARREHASSELRLKLMQRGYADDVIRQALAQLIDRDYLSDQRFVEVFLRHRCEQGYGPIRLVADMQARGVDDAIYRPFLDALEVDWIALARDQKRRRFGPGKPPNRKEWARQGRFLAGRGFTAEQVYTVLGEEDDLSD